jgi:RNA polymerase sigma-32 factor
MWWIRASIQEYILRSWSLVKMGTTAAQKKLFFNLRKAKSEIDALEEGDLRPENVALIATKLGVTHDEVISMNRRLSGPDSSLNAPLRSDSESEWQDWLQDDAQVSQETTVAENEERHLRMGLLGEAMQELSDRERHILTERRLQENPTTPGGARLAVRRQPRARPPDRGPRVREAAKGDAGRRHRAEPGRRLGIPLMRRDRSSGSASAA